MPMGVYEKLIRPLMFQFEPERAQSLADWILRRRWLWRLASRHYNISDPRLEVAAAGLRFPSPVGLAAGYDKHCEILDSLLALGFGYITAGTVRREPQPGNPKPRIFRQPQQESLINSLGFPSKGMAAASENLSELSHEYKPLVVSIAGLTIAEFVSCYTTLQPFADAIELNISSPNTQGLRVFQEDTALKDLIQSLDQHRTKPLFLKIPPYFNDEERERVLQLVHVARDFKIDGITVANTHPIEMPQLAVGRGGLSGKPLLEHTLRMVADVRAELDPSVAVNACGGIFNSTDTLRALRAGANTVQLFTGLIYKGPSVARSINQDLVRLMDLSGSGSLQELVHQES